MRIRIEGLMSFPRIAAVLFAAGTLALTSCSTGAPSNPVATPVMASYSIQGRVHGGQQPVSGSTIQLYTVGTSADYSNARALLTSTVRTGTDGSFSITGLYSCSSATQVYIIATGGSPSPSGANTNLSMMTALGPCTSLSASTFVTINELTTAAAVSALAPFMTSMTAAGANTYDASALAQDFTLATELVNTATGTAPGTNVPSGESVDVPLINTMGNILASCINSTGGTSGDGSPCGTLFSLAKDSSGNAPTDVIGAMLNIANHPAANTSALFNLSPATAPFAPAYSTVPSSYRIHLVPTATGVTRSILVEPDAGFNSIYSLINNAQSAVDMTMYELVDTTMSGDLVNACKRGVRVRVILDQNSEMSSNTPAYNQLNAQANCSAVWANTHYSVTHQKSIVIDGTQAVIMTLNMASRYYTQDRDFALVTNDPVDIAAMEAAFNADYNMTYPYATPTGNDLVWSPTNAQSSLISIINNATSTLLVEAEEMSATNIVNALKAACQRGVAVHITMTDSGSYHTNFTALENAGCGVHTYAENSHTMYIHAKVLLADYGTNAQVAYMGSTNFSTASLTSDRELGLYLYDSAILQTLNNTLTSDYAGAPAY